MSTSSLNPPPSALLAQVNEELAATDQVEFPEAVAFLTSVRDYVANTQQGARALLRGRGSASSALRHFQNLMETYLSADKFSDEEKVALREMLDVGMPVVRKQLQAEIDEGGW